jgi:hypothetical protein
MLRAAQERMFGIGLLIYGISFCLVAVGETKSSPGNQPLFGFACASMALIYPVIEARAALLHNVPIVLPLPVYVSLLISGWINPLFMTAVFLDLTNHLRAVRILRFVVLSLIPSSWFVIFLFLRAYPREGHFLWIIGMLLVLFPDQVSGRSTTNRRISAMDSKG